MIFPTDNYTKQETIQIMWLIQALISCHIISSHFDLELGVPRVVGTIPTWKIMVLCACFNTIILVIKKYEVSNAQVWLVRQEV